MERWTAVDKRMVVEHWCPAAAYPAGDKVMGIVTGWILWSAVRSDQPNGTSPREFPLKTGVSDYML